MRNHLIAAFLVGGAIAGFAQGTVRFTNCDFSGGVDAPIFDWDGTTKISGTQYLVRLLASTNVQSLVPVATTGVSTNSFAGLGTNIPGYFDGGVVTITNIPAGSIVFARIQVWNTLIGATPEEAKACGCFGTYGQSAVFQVVTGNPLASPPDPPGLLVALTSITLTSLSPPPTPPMLGVHYTETNTLAIAWGSLYWRFVLEQSPDFNATNWITVTNVPQLVNFRSQVTLPTPSSKMFYRLRSQ